MGRYLTPTRVAESCVDSGGIRQRTRVTERCDLLEKNGSSYRPLCKPSAVLSTPTPSATVVVSLHEGDRRGMGD
jgi:hypothetical protein